MGEETNSITGWWRRASGAIWRARGLAWNWPVGLRYAFAAAVTVATVLCHLEVSTLLGNRPVAIVLMIPVVLSAYLGGLGPGLASTMLGTVSAWYTLTPPAYSFQITHVEDGVRLVCLGLVGGLISLVCESLRRAKNRMAMEMAEREGREAQNLRLATAVEQAAEGVVITDAKGIIQYVNPAFSRITGYSSKEAIGGTPGMLKSGQHGSSFYLDLWGTILSGRVWHGEIINRRKDGKLYTEEMTIAPVRDAQGQISNFIAIKQDIAARKLAEQELKRQLSLMKCITDKATDSIFLTDAAGRVTFLNPEAERVFGFAASEAKGRNLHDLIHHHRPDGRAYPASECPVTRTFETGETLRDYEEVYIRKDGSLVDVMGSTALLEAEGERQGIVYMLHDVTEQKRCAGAKLQAQKLQALGTIAGGIAHDFNNILGAINGNTQFAISELEAGRPVQEYLSEIAKAGARAADLVRRILAFATPGKQKREVQALGPVVEEALKLVKATLPASIEVEMDFAPDVPPVKVDLSQVHQIIVNLATNSAHAIGERPGRIEVRIDAMRVHAEDISPSSKLGEGRYVRLYIGDDGCGIEPRILERIFDPFFTTKPVGRGTGLGLSVVLGIVTSHFGAITVDSEPGKGTAFHVYLPAAEQAAERGEHRGQQRTEGQRRERVLYVDDEEALVFVARNSLERRGCQVAGFTDPEEALREFRSRPWDFDVVVTDVSMPRMSGFDLARELQAVRGDIPIVVTSGYVRPEDEVKAAGLQIQEIVAKPCRMEDLVDAFDRVAASHGITKRSTPVGIGGA